MSCCRKKESVYAKIKSQISKAVTAQLISAFVFAIQIVQSLIFYDLKFQAFNHLLWLHRPICARFVSDLVGDPNCFSHAKAQMRRNSQSYKRRDDGELKHSENMPMQYTGNF